MVAQNSQNAQAIDPVYAQVFADDFNRTVANIDNGWQANGGTWIVNGNEAEYTTVGSNWSPPLLQPSSIQDGKAIITIPATEIPYLVSQYLAFGIHARANLGATSSSYCAFYYGRNNAVAIMETGTSGKCNAGTALLSAASIGATLQETSGDLKIEFIVEQATSSSTRLTLTIYNGADAVYTTSIIDTSAGLQNTAGQWGIAVSSNNAAATRPPVVSDFRLYVPQEDIQLSMVSDKDNIKLGDSITYTFTDDEDRVITLSDGGAGGSFSPGSVTLNSGNSYTATATYTPTKLGNIEISGQISGGDTLQKGVFISPYSTTIGFIGDSITFRNTGQSPQSAVNALGSGFTASKNGIGSTSTASWANDSFSGQPILTNAITAMNSTGVDIVHIMLGANDAAGAALTAAQYENNMQTIIDRLHLAGFKHVVISYPIYASKVVNDTLLTSYFGAIDNIVANNGGFVLLGDTSAYQCFKTVSDTNCVLASDGVHPTSAGYDRLGQFWASAIKSNLLYQINPDHEWLAADNEFQLGETGTLTHSIDKWFGEFEGDVYVDGIALGAGDFVATAGSTNIELTNAFLNSLAVGSHNLNIGFYGGVNIRSNFNILAAANTGGNNGDTGNNTGVGNRDFNAPNTGLFGLSDNATISLLGGVAILALLGSILLGCRLLTKKD